MISQIVKLFEVYQKITGFSDSLLHVIVFHLLLFGFLLTLLGKGWKLVARCFLWRNQRLLNRDLHPYYSAVDVERATRYYVPLNCQNVSPSEDDEPGRQYLVSTRQAVIPLFVRDVFSKPLSSNKYFLILADAGMGKTTFMINLYIAYRNHLRTPFSPQKYDIRLLPLGHPGVLGEIGRINNKNRTILLLDAFDEDIEAYRNHRSRLTEILQAVYEFRAIIITCRTQFFPSRLEEPTSTGYFSFGESGEYKFQKLYLSVFSDRDVARYLRKRYSWLTGSRKYAKAWRIVHNSPSLVMRPMLLSYIDDLVQTEGAFHYSFQIYQALIDKWLIRESKKPGIIRQFGSRNKLRHYLLEFSRKLALALYHNREQYGGYFLPPGEPLDDDLLTMTEDGETVFRLPVKTGKSQSLLNRDSQGNYKFSHRSIMEYILAREVVSNPAFGNTFDFTGLDGTQQFCREMILDRLNRAEGKVLLNEVAHFVPLGKDIIKAEDTICALEIRDIKDFNPALFRLLLPVIRNLDIRTRETNLWRNLILGIGNIYVIDEIIGLLAEKQNKAKAASATVEAQFFRNLSSELALRRHRFLGLRKKLEDVLEECRLSRLEKMLKAFDVPQFKAFTGSGKTGRNQSGATDVDADEKRGDHLNCIFFKYSNINTYLSRLREDLVKHPLIQTNFPDFDPSSPGIKVNYDSFFRILEEHHTVFHSLIIGWEFVSNLKSTNMFFEGLDLLLETPEYAESPPGIF